MLHNVSSACIFKVTKFEILIFGKQFELAIAIAIGNVVHRDLDLYVQGHTKGNTNIWNNGES